MSNKVTGGGNKSAFEASSNMPGFLTEPIGEGWGQVGAPDNDPGSTTMADVDITDLDLGSERMAVFADQAYKSPDTRAPNIHGYRYDESLSGARIAVYHNPDSRKTIVGLRGTADVKDVLTDVGLAKGTLRDEQHFKDARDDVERVLDVYGNEGSTTHKITLTGHSLGGTTAEELSRDLDVRAYSFNAGRGLVSQKGGREDGDYSKVTALRTANDIVSAHDSVGPRFQTQFQTRGRVSTHSLSHYEQGRYWYET